MSIAAPAKPRPSIWARLANGIVRGLRREPRVTGKRAPAYVAAGPSRSRDDWTLSNAGPNTVGAASRASLTARARDLIRNDPHCARIVSVHVQNIVGTGILATAKHDGTPEGKARAKMADWIWSEACKAGVLDNSGQLTGDGLQVSECRAWVGDGDVFIRRIVDLTARPVPMRIQVLEADMLDERQNGQVLPSGNRIVQGVEVNPSGRRIAYWFLTAHPGETYALGGSGPSVRVDASDVHHLMRPLRPGQVRGITELAPIMAQKKDLGDFEAFTLTAKKTEALLVGVITRQPYDEWNPRPEIPYADEDDEDEPSVLVPGVINSDGDLVGDMRPGAFLAVENGTDIKFNQPQIASNYDVFKKTHLQSCAIGTNLSYEQLSGDFSAANYSTMRGGMLEFWRHIDTMIWVYFVPAQDRVWQWVMESAWLAGLIDSPNVEAEWQPPKRQSIEPDKDAIADYLELRAGWVDEDDLIAARGYNPTALREKTAKNKAERDARSIVVDTDPTKMSWRGASPAATPTPLAESAPDAGKQQP